MAGNSKNALKPFQMIVSGDMSADITGTPTNIMFMDNVSIELQFTGTPTGTFYVDVSNTYDPISNPTPTWITLPLSPTPVATGVAGVVGIDYNQSGFEWVRVRYTRTSGSGTLDGYIAVKAV